MAPDPWSRLREEILACHKCGLAESRTQAVPGIGPQQTPLVIIGEAPGRQEDVQGEPFVGAAGKRLNKLLALAGIDVNDCYITNVVKCRPPKNRTPRKAERLSCYNWLRQELQLVRPSTIITLGATPLSLFTNVGISQLHGTQFEVELDIDG